MTSLLRFLIGLTRVPLNKETADSATMQKPLKST